LEKKLVAGYDIQKNEVQLSFYIEDREDAESVSPPSNPAGYEIPCLIAKTKDGWAVGEAALLEEAKQPGCLVDWLILRVLNREMEVLEGYSAEDLLEIFLRETLLFIPGVEMIGRELDAIAISLWEQNGYLFDVVFRCLMRLGVKENVIFAMSDQESAACYALSREKELWRQDVLFFDFSIERFLCRRLYRNQKTQEIILEMGEEDYSEQFSMDLLSTEEGQQQLDQNFLELLTYELKKSPVSCVYLIGEGFCRKENWAVKALKYLCNRKRVFLGMNLYTKGASIGAYDHIEGRLMEALTKRMSGCAPVSIGIRAWKKGEKRLINLVKEGINWYHAKARIEGILDGLTEIDFIITRKGLKGKLEYRLPLTDFPYREPKMTRVELSLSFLSEKEAILQITDLGFGQYAESSGAVIRKQLSMTEFISSIKENQKEEETGRFLLCSSKRSRHPYEVEEGRQAIYSIDELCYYLYHNSFLIEREFFNEDLIAFIRDSLELKMLAEKLEYGVKEEATLEELVEVVMNSTSYYEETQKRELREKLSYFGTQNREERLKLLGDMYLSERRFIDARNQYYLLLKLEPSSNESGEFFGKVYHNIGVLFMELFYFEEACEYLKKAYLYLPCEEILKKLLLSFRLAGMEVGYIEWSKKTDSRNLLKWEDEWKRQEEEAGQDGRNSMAMEAFLYKKQGKPGQFEEYAKKQLREWMDEYRYEMEG